MRRQTRLIPRLNNSWRNPDSPDLRWLRSLWKFEMADFYVKNVLCRSVSLKEMKEDLAKFKKAIGWKERPMYAS
ncbi:hypothetical protein ES702_03969 [subsurface metagenome]